MESSASTRVSSDLRDRYRQVTQRLADAASSAGRDPASALLIAVTDHASPDEIRQIVQMGQIDLGESNLQQLPHRAGQLSEFLTRQRFLGRFRPRNADDPADASTADLPKVRWHLLGSVPRAQVRLVAPLVKLVHGVDNLRVAEDLHAFALRLEALADQNKEPQAPSPIELLIQVNASGRNDRSGVVPPAVLHLGQQIDTMVSLRLRGLSLALRPDDDAAAISNMCQRCAELFEDMRSARVGGASFNVLCMGNSQSIEAAVAAGANLVPVGRALFNGQSH